MKKALFIVLLLLSGTAFAGSSDDVMFIRGTVVDQQTSEALSGVEVRVKGTDIVVYTDFDGNFSLPDLPGGSYELEFHYITYSTKQVVSDNCTHCPTMSVEMSVR